MIENFRKLSKTIHTAIYPFCNENWNHSHSFQTYEPNLVIQLELCEYLSLQSCKHIVHDNLKAVLTIKFLPQLILSGLKFLVSN